MSLRLLEAQRADPARELQREMVRVWSQMDRIDRDAAQRVLNAVAEMRRDVLDRLAALPVVTIDDHDSFEATALRGFAIDLQDAARRFEERYSLLLGEDMRAAATYADEAHRAALTQLARASGVPQSFIAMSPLGLSDTQMEAAALLNNSAIRNVSQNVVTRVNAEVQAVVYGGQSRWDAVKNIRDALGTGQNLGALTNRAITIERTGVMQAFNIAADHAYRQAQEELPDLQVEWVTAKDKRVDPLCVSMNGKRKEPRGTFPGGIVAPPRHPRCLVAGTVVASPRVLATSERGYVGEVIEIRTAAGHILTVTPNHPILTPSGWLAAGRLYEGCDVISSPDAQRLAATVSPDEYHGPAVIEQITRSFNNALAVASVTMPVSPEDFHGDGGGSEVCVIRANGLLWNTLDATLRKPDAEELLSRMDVEAEPLTSLSRLALRLERIRSAALSGMSSLHGSHASFRGAAGLFKAVRLGNRASLYTGALQSTGDSLARDGVALAYTLLGLSAEIEADQFVGVGGYPEPMTRPTRRLLTLGSQDYAGSLKAAAYSVPRDPVLDAEFVPRSSRLVSQDQVVEVRRIPEWSGQVYNLETSLGWYIASGIVTHNCRCRTVAYLTAWEGK